MLRNSSSKPRNQLCLAVLVHIGVLGVMPMSGCGNSAGGVNIWNAVASDDVDAIERYATAGGDLNCRNISGNTPLMVAFDSKQVASYERLLELGADPNVTMSDRRTLTAWAAARKEDTTWLRLALAHGGDPNLLSSSRASKSLHPPLRFATSNGSLEHATLLIDHGADVDDLGETGQRPLIYAIGSGRYDVVLLLLQSGADYTADDTVPWSFLEAVRRIRANEDIQLVNPKMREGFQRVESWLHENGVDMEG
jgi:uncharacterized protein